MPGAYTTTTDATGFYAFLSIPPGTYSVTETIPTGWSASNPLAGTASATVVAGTPAVQNFLNCRKKKVFGVACPQLLDQWLDSTCCVYHVSIPASLQRIVSVTYAIGGGVLESITSAPCIGTHTVVDAAHGTLAYTPACADTLALAIDAVPTTATGEVSVTLTVVTSTIGHGLDTCVYSFKYTCARPVQSNCDVLVAAPYPQENVSIDFRTFTITNEKYPPSPICSIDIAITDSTGLPPLSGWQGGNLYFDGVPVPTATRFVFPYNRIPNAGAADLAADSVNESVAFNLGIDYTTPYTGTVTFVVRHCDGYSCVLVYGPWTPAPPPLIPLTTSVAEDDRVLSHYRVRAANIKGLHGNVRWLSVSTLDVDATIVAASSIVASSSIVGASSPSKTISTNVALFEFPSSVVTAMLPDVFVVVARKRGSASGDICVTAYDNNATAIGSSLVSTSYAETFSVVVPTNVNELEEPSFMLAPNPATESITLDIPASEAHVRIRIVSLTGGVVLTTTLQTVSGRARGVVSVAELARGAYIVEYDSGVPLQCRSRIFVRD